MWRFPSSSVNVSFTRRPGEDLYERMKIAAVRERRPIRPLVEKHRAAWLDAKRFYALSGTSPGRYDLCWGSRERVKEVSEAIDNALSIRVDPSAVCA